MCAQNKQTLTLTDLFRLIEENNRTLTAQRSAVEVADEALKEARDRRLPDINVSASLTYNGNVLMTDRNFSNVHGYSSPHFGNSLTVEARELVYAGGAVDAGIRLAELGKQQAALGVTTTRQDERFLALGQYLDLYKTLNAQRVYLQNIALTAQVIENIQAKHAQGMVLKNDVTRYELQMETLRLGLRKLQDRQIVLNHQLCNTLGLRDVILVPDTTLTDAYFPREGVTTWKEKTLATSPQLQRAALDRDITEQNVLLAKSDLRPKVSVFATNAFAGPFTYDLPPVDKNTNVWYVGVGITYPLSSLFKGKANLKRAQVSHRRAAEQYDVVAEHLDNSIHEAHNLYEQAYEDLRTRQKSVELAAQNYDVVRNRYLNQIALITDMIDAANVRLDAELQEVDARINIIYAYYRMKYLAGEI